MKPSAYAMVMSMFFAAVSFGQDAGEIKSANWPQWLGPLATGVALNADPPVE